MIDVIAVSPTERIQRCFVQQRFGAYKTEFVADEAARIVPYLPRIFVAGEWRISITYQDEHIQGSPFSCLVYNPSRVKVSGPESAVLGGEVRFVIDATEAGPGVVEVSFVPGPVEVSRCGKTIDTSMEQIDRGRYLARFVPQSDGRYELSATLNGHKVRDSPFTMEVVSASSVKVFGAGLHSASVDHLAVFRIVANGVESREITVTITSPSDKKKRARLIPEDSEGTYRAEWKPIEAGEHSIDVRVHGQSINHSPFDCNVGDPELVTVRNLPKQIKHSDLGNPVSFNIVVLSWVKEVCALVARSHICILVDASAAGSGNLEIMVNEGRVHCQVRDLGQRAYVATFIPAQPTTYVIRMTFNGLPVKVNPVDNVTFQVVGNLLTASKRLLLRIQDSPWILQVVQSPIFLHDQSSSVSMSSLPLGNVILASPLSIDQLQTGGLSHYACLTSPGALPALLQSPVASSHSPDRLRAFSKVDIMDRGAAPVWADIYGEGLQMACAGKPAVFDILAYSLTLKDIGVKIMSMDGKELFHRLTESRPGHFRCEYICSEVGKKFGVQVRLVRVDVSLSGQPAEKSPYLVNSYDPAKVVIEPVPGGAVGKPVQFTIDASQAGKGQLEISINEGKVPNSVQLQSAGRCLVTFIPDKGGLYVIDVTLNGQPVRGCPLKVDIFGDAADRIASDGISPRMDSNRSPLWNRAYASPVSSILGGEQRYGDVKWNMSKLRSATDAPTRIYQSSVDSSRDGEPVYSNVCANSDAYYRRAVKKPSPMQMSEGQMDNFYRRHVINSDTTSSALRSAVGVTTSSSMTTSNDRSQMAAEESFKVYPGKSVHSYQRHANYALRFGKGDLPQAHSEEVTTYSRKNGVLHAETEEDRIDYGDAYATAMFGAKEQPTVSTYSATIDKDSSDGYATVNRSAHRMGSNNLQTEATSTRPHLSAENKQTSLMPRSDDGPAMGDEASLSTNSNKSESFSRHQASQPAAVPAGTDGSNKQEPINISVEEEEGNYVVHFVPSTVGIYKVRFSVMDEPHPQSPVTLKVYNPDRVVINDIVSSTVGKPVQFTVDATHAGHGDLEIAIKDENGTTVPSKVMSQESNANFKVSFSPQRPGKHGIHVTFNGECIPGSPFVCNVKESETKPPYESSTPAADVRQDVRPAVISATVSDQLPKLVSANKAASFHIATSAKDTSVEPMITGPDGKRLEANVKRQGSTGYLVEFTPTAVGDHQLDVRVNDQQVTGLPSTCRVYDASRIEVSRIPDIQPSKPVHFIGIGSINASEAGMGNLEVAVNDGKVLSMAQNLGHHRYDISFVPTESIAHTVSIRFNGDHVPGSPFKSRVLPVATKALIHAASLEKVAVGQPASFELEVPDEDALDLTIKDPSGALIPWSKSGSDDGKVKVEFAPKSVGLYQIDVRYDDVSLPGSPFTCKAYDSGQVKLLPAVGNTLGEPVSFVIDAAKAGTGNMEIFVSVDGRNVPNQVQAEGSARFKVMFTPQEAKLHVVSVKFNGEPVPGSPMTVAVVETGSCEAFGPGISTTVAGSTANFTMNLNDKRTGECNVIVTAPDETTLPVKCFKQKDGNFRVEYKPSIVGEHKVEVSVGDQQIKGSPFKCIVFNPDLVRIVKLDRVVVGKEASVKVNTSRAGKADLTAEVADPDGLPIDVEVLRDQEGEDELRFLTGKVGQHTLTINYGGQDVLENPMIFFAEEAEDSAAAKTQNQCILAETARLLVEVPNGKDEVKAKITDADGHSVKCNTRKRDDGKWEITFLPVDVGYYTIDAQVHRKSLADFPMRFTVVDPRKVRVVEGIGRKPLVVGQRSYIIVDAQGAGPGELKADVRGPSGRSNVGVEAQQEFQHRISFVPLEEGEYSIYLYWNGVCVPGSPLLVCAKSDNKTDINARKVITSGSGLKEACTKVEAEFIIDGTQAGPGLPMCRMTGQKGNVPIALTPIEPNKWKATYTAPLAGSYSIEISWSNQPIRGSPFRVQVMHSGNADHVAVHKDALKNCVIGKSTRVLIDARKAGLGEITAKFTGPTKSAKSELVDDEDGFYTLILKPTETGKHVLSVKFNGEDVPGSPFKIPVSSQPDVTKVHVYGSGVEHGVLSTFDSTFYVDTTGAGAGQLAVRIKGPKGAFHVEMERDKRQERLIVCRYEPQEQGDYIVEVKWAGEHVLGSPFLVVIFDTYQELDRFLSGVNVNTQPTMPFFPPGWVGQPPPGMFLPMSSAPLFPPPPPMSPTSMHRVPAIMYGSAPASPYFSSKAVH
ncbi:Putative filamin [Trichuris trichiura]|uniref:Putative filamin n=1 Tax=Trichuris trichiura TaxID=36087 RepID=A0A077Z827_TRITR|nr:Putative filamin [Trichuris trichiura]